MDGGGGDGGCISPGTPCGLIAGGVIRPCQGSVDHVFCEKCFQDWVLEVKVNQRRLTCPVCRTEIRDSFMRMAEGESRQYFYDHPDKIWKILNYREGKFHGRQLYYFRNSMHDDYLELELNYEDGLLEGVQRRYQHEVRFRNRGFFDFKYGLKKEAPYRRGLCHGICREWHLNGRLKAEYLMEDGLLHGEGRFYNGWGKLISEVLFEKGVVKRVITEGESM